MNLTSQTDWAGGRFGDIPIAQFRFPPQCALRIGANTRCFPVEARDLRSSEVASRKCDYNSRDIQFLHESQVFLFHSSSVHTPPKDAWLETNPYINTNLNDIEFSAFIRKKFWFYLFSTHRHCMNRGHRSNSECKSLQISVGQLRPKRGSGKGRKESK